MPEDSVPPLHLETRVVRVEGALESLHEDVTGIKTELRSVASSVNAGFETLRREQNQAKQVNWGWIAAFIAVGVAIIGAITTALVQPLQTFDSAIKERIEHADGTAQKAFEQSIRNDERLKAVERAEDRRSEREEEARGATTPRGQ